MPWITELTINHLTVFLLVLSRVTGLMLTAPFFLASQTPRMVRALLVVAISLLMMPSQALEHAELHHSLVQLVVAMGGELIVGATLGLGTMIIFSGIQLAGQIISQISGLSVAEVFNPALNASVPLFSELLNLLALAVFITIGGHRIIIGALLDTFAFVPLGGAEMPASLPETVVGLLSQSFDFGIRIAAPAIAAQLMATLMLGIVSRTVPQLNILAVGFGINALVTFGMLALSLGGMAWLLEDQVEPMVEVVLGALRSAVAVPLTQ